MALTIQQRRHHAQPPANPTTYFGRQHRNGSNRSMARIDTGRIGSNDKFDLLIRNANVLDPSQNLSGKRDIGIRFGRIEAIETQLLPEKALRVLDTN